MTGQDLLRLSLCIGEMYILCEQSYWYIRDCLYTSMKLRIIDPAIGVHKSL